MKQRSDPRSAKFFRPKLVQVIEWKLNGHAEVLAQPIHCCDAVVVAAMSAAKLLKQMLAAASARQLRSYRDDYDRDQRDACAEFRKQVTVLHVKR